MASLFRRLLRWERTSPSAVTATSTATVPDESSDTSSMPPAIAHPSPDVGERMPGGKVAMTEPLIDRLKSVMAHIVDASIDAQPADATPRAHGDQGVPDGRIPAVPPQLLPHLGNVPDLLDIPMHPGVTAGPPQVRASSHDVIRLQADIDGAEQRGLVVGTEQAKSSRYVFPGKCTSLLPSSNGTYPIDEHQQPERDTVRTSPSDSHATPPTATTIPADALTSTLAEAPVVSATAVASATSSAAGDRSERGEVQRHPGMRPVIDHSSAADTPSPRRAMKRRRAALPTAPQPPEADAHTAALLASAPDTASTDAEGTDDTGVLELPGRPLRPKEMPSPATRLILYGYARNGRVVVSPEIYSCVGTLWCGPAQLWQLVRYEDREAAGDPRNLIARFTVKDTSRIRVIEEATADTKGAKRRTTREQDP